MKSLEISDIKTHLNMRKREAPIQFIKQQMKQGYRIHNGYEQQILRQLQIMKHKNAKPVDFDVYSLHQCFGLHQEQTQEVKRNDKPLDLMDQSNPNPTRMLPNNPKQLFGKDKVRHSAIESEMYTLKAEDQIEIRSS